MNWIAGYKQHYKALIFLGLPIVIGQVGVIILGFADTLMIGHHSTEELGAASFVNNVIYALHHFQYRFQLRADAYRGQSLRQPPFCGSGAGVALQFGGECLVALLLTFIMTVVYFNVERLGNPRN